ncbi:MAG TPA: hypothetical protein VMR81_01700 [Patescibacteria group bacterium]|nr:hypothetical protein [Patescibacteria group bacterium]
MIFDWKKRFLSNTSLLVFIFIVLLQLVIHVYLQVQPAAMAPHGYVVIPPNDELGYISVIRQTMHGPWTFTEPYTTRPTPEIVIFAPFILGGKIAGLFHIDPVVMYSIIKITGSIAASIATYILILNLLPMNLRVLGLIFTFLVETGPDLAVMFTKPFTSWVAASPGIAIVARQFGYPHTRWGEACALTLLIIFLTTRQKFSYKRIIAVILLSIAGVLFLPSVMVVFSLAVYIPYAITDVIRRRDFRRIFPVIISLCVIGAAGLWTRHELMMGPPWNTFTDFERAWWTTSDVLKQYLQSALLYLPWIAVYVIAGRRKIATAESTPVPLLMALWICIPVGIIFIEHYLPWFFVANGRIAVDGTNIPFAVLATLGAETLLRVLKNKRIVANGMIILFMSVSLFLSFQFVSNFLNAQNYTNDSEIYIPLDVWKGFQFLATVPSNSGILTRPTSGMSIPTFADVRSFVGPTASFLDYEDRLNLSWLFYSEKMTEGEAREFLKNNDISYVYFGPEEQLNHGSGSPLYPALLTSVYQVPQVTIYKVLPIE